MTVPDIDRIIQQLCEAFIAAAKIDYVGFWEVAAAVSNSTASASDSERIDITLAVSRCMIDRGLRVFTFVGGKPPPVFWNDLTTDAVVDRIREELDLKGKAVGLGDVCWFAASSI
jgi:hypothetical protein